MAWSDSERMEILKALSVVCEVTGATFSGPAKMFVLAELEPFEAGEILQALRRCAHECRYRLSLGDIIQRIEEDREKEKASRRAKVSIEDTRLRLLALEQRIPWELGKERVKELLGKLALPAPDPTKEAARARSIAHWSEPEEKD